MSTAWITLALDDFRVITNETQLDRLQTVKIDVSQADPVTAAIADAITQVRGVISAGGMVLSATAASIPPSLKIDSLYIALSIAAGRLQGLGLTPFQKEQIERALEVMARIAEGKRSVEPPTDPEAAAEQQQSTAGISVVSSTPHRTGRSNFNGLL